MKRVFHHAPENLGDELVSDANYACLTAKKPPDDPAKAPAWVARVTANTVLTHFRRSKKDLRWLNREVDVEEVAPSELHDGPLDVRVDFDWLLETWLDKRVAKVPTDPMTLEMIRHKARTGQTDEQVVVHFGLSSVSAFSSRIHYFKRKYEHRRQRYLAQRRRTWMLVLKVAVGVVAVAVAALIVSLLWRPRLFAVPEPPVPTAAPSASADARPLDQALPPPDIPQKLKPVP
jgi:hypothetical protein